MWLRILLGQANEFYLSVGENGVCWQIIKRLLKGWESRDAVVMEDVRKLGS